MEEMIQTDLIDPTVGLPAPAEGNGAKPVGRPKGLVRKPSKVSLDKKPFIREIIAQHGSQVPLPLELRDALQINRGDTVVLWKENDTIVIRKIQLEIKADELIVRR